jgi:hypothetical protein
MLPENGCMCFDETTRHCPIHIEPNLNYHPTFENITVDVANISKQIVNSGYTDFVIVGVAKGGLVPAVILANLLKYPMRCVEYSSKTGKGDNKDHFNYVPSMLGGRLLIIDDICDSGKTFEELVQILRPNREIKTAALYTKQSSQFQPDFYAHKMIGQQEVPWVVFPWEF